MRDLRMPKGWTLIGTNRFEFNSPTKEEKRKNIKKLDRAIRNIEKKSYEKLQEESDQSYIDRENTRNQLMKAYAEKRLRSKKLIKEARSYNKMNNNESIVIT